MTSVATLGSHCALQVLKGAHDEGLESILVCEKKRERLYRRFSFIDEIIPVDSFVEVLDQRCQRILEEHKSILIPHGTLIAQLDPDQIESIKTPMFGNKWILRWESDRRMKENMMRAAGLHVPAPVDDPSHINSLVIVKRQGAAGGRGYFMASSESDFNAKRDLLVRQNIISPKEQLYIQEYVPGVLAYLQYFYSPLDENLEFYGVDQRHESDIEGLARIPSEQQLLSSKVSSFNVIGNSPMVLRESLLDVVYDMGDGFVDAAKKLASPGMPGPFCIEGVYDEHAKFSVFEFSARIVAGTNIYMNGSPYSTLLYDSPMSMGRRISREIRLAAESGRLDVVTT